MVEKEGVSLIVWIIALLILVAVIIGVFLYFGLVSDILSGMGWYTSIATIILSILGLKL